MNTGTTRSLEHRKRFGLLMSIGVLLFVAALVYIRLQESKPWPSGPRHLVLISLPVIVYLVSRYARTDIVVTLLALGLLAVSASIAWPSFEIPDPFLFLVPVIVCLVYRYVRRDLVIKLLALSLLALSASIVLTPHGMPDEFMWIKAAATGLCGIGLLMGVRWAAHLWLVFAGAVLIDVVKLGRWNLDAGLQYGMLLLLTVAGLLLLIFGVGGSVAIASEANATTGGRLSSRLGELRASRGFAIVCSVAALLVAVQWFVTLIPDPEGFEKLHPSIKPTVRMRWSSVHEEPFCTAITHCGPYVELTCHPERDGPVSYYNNTSGKLIASCSFFGNWCGDGQVPEFSRNCNRCPPPEWSGCTASGASAPR